MLVLNADTPAIIRMADKYVVQEKDEALETLFLLTHLNLHLSICVDYNDKNFKIKLIQTHNT